MTVLASVNSAIGSRFDCSDRSECLHIGMKGDGCEDGHFDEPAVAGLGDIDLRCRAFSNANGLTRPSVR